MTQDRRFKHRVRRRMQDTGENYATALAAEQRTRPPPRRSSTHSSANDEQEKTLMRKPAVATRLRGIWLGVTDFQRSRSFYEQLGAHFDDIEPTDGIVHATLGGTRLIFELGHGNPGGTGAFLLFDVTDADALHGELEAAGCNVEGTPKDEPWGRQFNVRDPDGYSMAFIGPVR